MTSVLVDVCMLSIAIFLNIVGITGKWWSIGFYNTVEELVILTFIRSWLGWLGRRVEGMRILM